jgi:hypothetical protein
VVGAGPRNDENAGKPRAGYCVKNAKSTLPGLPLTL